MYHFCLYDNADIIYSFKVLYNLSFMPFWQPFE